MHLIRRNTCRVCGSSALTKVINLGEQQFQGHFLTCRLLKMKYDATGAFRLYRLNRVPEHFFDLVSSNSYSFFFESLFILAFNKFRIKEIPIVLPSRTYGHSKMRVTDALGSLKFLLIIYLKMLFNRGKFKMSNPVKYG